MFVVFTTKVNSKFDCFSGIGLTLSSFSATKPQKDTMKAATIQNYGDAIEITDFAKPNLQDDSVIIEVHAASLNPIDNILHMGYLKEIRTGH